ncbi:MAG: tetratricopeptide repeat protein [Gammaproteobacteria bacterium]
MALFKLLPLAAALALAAGCSLPAVKASAPDPAPAQPASAVAEAAPAEQPDPVEEAHARAQAALPKQPLTPEILFKFLVAEVAGQRGAVALSQTTYLDLAQQTKDPRIARRAAEVAMYARDQAGALEATRIWAASDPESPRARQALAALLLGAGRFDEAEPLLRALLQQDRGNAYLHLSALMGKPRDTEAALRLVERLAADAPELPEARFAVAQAASAAGRFDAAIQALQEADRLRPGWEPAALLRAQLHAKTSRAEALGFMREFLATYPAAREVRLAYARTLVTANQFTEARAEFVRLVNDYPGNPEVSLAAGLLSLQMGDYSLAQAYLDKTLEANPRDPDTVHYYLGQAAEQMKAFDRALEHYGEVGAGAHLVPARARQAALLARLGKRDQAQALLAATRGENDAQNVRLIQAQAELLREYKEHASAFELLSSGLKRFPDAADLLYDRAMVAEKLGKLDVLETDLRRVIVLRPEDAQAYNALGYTLADRTDRIAEAVELLDKALSLAPDDPFILDSVGWAQYRSGNLVRAQEYLERAYKARPDPEIAAHLGEVLWVRGLHDAAGQVWRSSIKAHPQNELLLETLQRFKQP